MGSPLDLIEQQGVLPVLRAPSLKCAQGAVKALKDAGMKVIEVTLTVPDAETLMEELREDDELCIGAGTVCNIIDLQIALRAGAKFVVGPHFDPTVAITCRRSHVPYFPGVLTPGEIHQALHMGAEMVKIFPVASVGGADYLKMLSGPYPQLRAMATGGVERANLAAYRQAGAVAVGAGGSLLKEIWMRAGKWNEITKEARSWLQEWQRSPVPAHREALPRAQNA